MTKVSPNLIRTPMSSENAESSRSLTILYATETGNAQDVSERLARQCRRLHFSAQVHSIDEYEVVRLEFCRLTGAELTLTRRTTSSPNTSFYS